MQDHTRRSRFDEPLKPHSVLIYVSPHYIPTPTTNRLAA
jgi:hypothetical protein